MDQSNKEIIENFKLNVASVKKLANFDRVVLEYAIKSIESLQNRLKNKFENERLLASTTLKQLNSIRSNDSMRKEYEEIFNQCIVLLVSYFGSAVSDVFRNYVTARITSSKKMKILQEELKFTIGELRDLDFNLNGQMGDIIARKKDISFQDMGSISRNFKDYLGIVVDKDNNINNIILGQACRHVIVHAGAVADIKLLNQISGATPRDIKEEINVGDKIQFSLEEIEVLSGSMMDYITKLVETAKRSCV
jgi:hypothetical protein